MPTAPPLLVPHRRAVLVGAVASGALFGAARLVIPSGGGGLAGLALFGVPLAAGIWIVVLGFRPAKRATGLVLARRGGAFLLPEATAYRATSVTMLLILPGSLVKYWADIRT